MQMLGASISVLKFPFKYWVSVQSWFYCVPSSLSSHNCFKIYNSVIVFGVDNRDDTFKKYLNEVILCFLGVCLSFIVLFKRSAKWKGPKSMPRELLSPALPETPGLVLSCLHFRNLCNCNCYVTTVIYIYISIRLYTLLFLSHGHQL